MNLTPPPEVLEFIIVLELLVIADIINSASATEISGEINYE